MARTWFSSRLHQFNAWLESSEDGAGLAAFRVLFGLAMAWDASCYVSNGWAWAHYAPDFLFKYYGWEWVTPLGQTGMLAVYVGMIVAGLMIAAGAFYRIAIVYFFVAHTYAFLLSASQYLNHAYLISLVAFLLIWMPANRCFAVDTWREDMPRDQPTPRWCRFTLQAQIAIVYGFGAIAKLNPDWLAGVPIAQWLGYSAERNPWAAELITAPLAVPVVLWGGILFDLLIVPALIWRRTRVLAFVASIGFHVSNSILFEIGVFPWMMLGATTLFFAPDWPRRVPGLRRWLAGERPPTAAPDLAVGRRWVVIPVAAWLVFQVAVPLRHHLYPGDVAWTEEGHLFAWRMKLRAKRGSVTFWVRDPATGAEWPVESDRLIERRQARRMAGRADLILQFAHFIAERERERLGHEVEVRVDAWVSLNYRPPQRFIDPERDLAQVEPILGHYDWILPFVWTPASRPPPR